MQLEAEDVLVGAAHLSVLHQRVLDLPGDGHGLSQQWRIIPEISLGREESRVSRTVVVAFYHILETGAQLGLVYYFTSDFLLFM